MLCSSDEADHFDRWHEKKESGEYFSDTLNICSDDQTDYRE